MSKDTVTINGEEWQEYPVNRINMLEAMEDGLRELITELEAPSAEKYVDGEYIPSRESVTERLRALLSKEGDDG